jgi:hypothetical protein
MLDVCSPCSARRLWRLASCWMRRMIVFDEKLGFSVNLWSEDWMCSKSGRNAFMRTRHLNLSQSIGPMLEILVKRCLMISRVSYSGTPFWKNTSETLFGRCICAHIPKLTWHLRSQRIIVDLPGVVQMRGKVGGMCRGARRSPHVERERRVPFLDSILPN